LVRTEGNEERKDQGEGNEGTALMNCTESGFIFVLNLQGHLKEKKRERETKQKVFKNGFI